MIKISIKAFCILLAALFLACSHNDNAVVLKELKQQNRFLKEQLQFARDVMRVKAQGNRWIIPYNNLFFKQDSAAMAYLKGLSTDINLNKTYHSFIEQSNSYFNSAQNNAATRILRDDIPLTQFAVDSLLLTISSDSLKKELIEQQILQRYLTIAQLYYSASTSCGIRFDNPDHFGYRLAIEKNSSYFLLNLKCFDPQRFPYFEKLEFVSLSQNNKGDYYYEDELTDIRSQLIEAKYEKDAIIIKTKPLSKGFYRIYSHKLSISDNGRIIKKDAEFDFEITENQ